MEDQLDESQFPNAPTTTEEYLALCTGSGKSLGHQQMYSKNILQCYRVTDAELKSITLEATEYLLSDAELQKGAESTGNSKDWKTSRSALTRWLVRESSWNTDKLFGEGNSTVPEEAKKEAMQRIASDAREEIKFNGAAYGLDPSIKQEYSTDQFFPSRSAAPSPARSATSIAASHMRDLDVSETKPFIANIRSCNISFNHANGDSIKRVTMKSALDPIAFNERAKLMTSMDVDYQRLRAAASSATLIEESYVQISFNGDKVGNQHEFEAAVNDFANGIRSSNNFDVVVASATHPTRRGREDTRPGRPSPATSLSPKKVPPPSLDPSKPARSNTVRPSRGLLSGRSVFGGPRPRPDLFGGGRTDRLWTDRGKTGRGKTGRGKTGGSETSGSESSVMGPSAKVKKGNNSRVEPTPSSEHSRSPSPQASPPVKYVALPNQDDKLDELDKENDGSYDDDYESKMLEFMQEKLGNSDAGLKAMRANVKEWQNGSDTWGISMKRLGEQHISKSRFIPVDPNLGFNPEMKLMAHQVVGSDSLHDMIFGDRHGSVLQDYMGMGKTIQMLSAFMMNVILEYEQDQGQPILPNQRLRLEPDGMYKGRSPRVGATFLSAYANGVEPWPRDWIKIVRNSPLLNQAPAAWRVKMVILHDSGPKLCTNYGGQANGLYSTLTMQDLVEMLPRPDWENKARSVYSFPSDLADGSEGSKVTYSGPSSWQDHPRATTSKPSPTSVRFFIVSTNKSWQSRVYDVVQVNFKAVTELDAAIKNLKPNATEQRRQLIAERRMAINNNMKGQHDGKQSNQATRLATWMNHKGRPKTVTMVCDLLYAAWVICDEIHSAGGENTITYTGIFDPFIRLVDDPALHPACTAITGSAMANGIVTVLVFALKALRREDPVWQKLPQPAIQLLQKRNLKETLKVWKAFEKATGRDINRSIAERIERDPKMTDILEVIAQIIGEYFIGRDYDSVDAWGHKLNLMDCKLEAQYLSIEYDDKYHQMLKDVEKNILAQVNAQNEEALQEWRHAGGENSGKPKPKPQSAARVDPRSYQKAKILASFPNFLNAIYEYQRDHPEVERLIGAGTETKWGDDLGKANLQLDEILKNPTKILGSIIYKAIDKICEGSAKMDHILYMAKKTSGEETTAPDPRKDQPGRPHITYRSKYCIASNVRLCKAIIYARLVKEFGRSSLAWVGEGVDKDLEVLRWRKFYDTENESVDDQTQFMVAGLKMVCQSIDLIEGHVFEGLEPHTINAEAVQFGYRGYRIGQVAPVVTLNYLLHAHSYVEELTYTRNMVKNNFAEQCRATQLNKIKAMATAMEIADEA